MTKQPEKTALTKKSIIDAFWVVAQKRGINNTTISEVTKCAKLNRSTFYVYFTDIEDLLYQIEKDIISNLRFQINNIIAKENFSDYKCVSAKIIEVLEIYNDKLLMLLGKNGDPMFLDFVRKEAAPIFTALLKSKKEIMYQDYIIAYLTSAFIGLIQFWYETGKEISLTELACIAHGIVTHGIFELNEQLENSL